MASVLIIDDHADSREALSRALLKSGLLIRSSPNGREALLEVVREVPDVIILDMMMPEMNGVEFLQIIRAYLRWASIPVVVVTGYPDGPHMDKAQQLEVRHVFRKADYKIADLVTCVAGLARDPNYGRSGGIGA